MAASVSPFRPIVHVHMLLLLSAGQGSSHRTASCYVVRPIHTRPAVTLRQQWHQGDT